MGFLEPVLDKGFCSWWESAVFSEQMPVGLAASAWSCLLEQLVTCLWKQTLWPEQAVMYLLEQPVPCLSEQVRKDLPEQVVTCLSEQAEKCLLEQPVTCLFEQHVKCLLEQLLEQQSYPHMEMGKQPDPGYLKCVLWAW